jgi:putative RNA 2'-phosphotransferase
MDKSLVQISKFLSYVLRHRPDKVGLTLDDQGWVDVGALLDSCTLNGYALSRETIERVVTTNDKQRFTISEDGTRIRANQGHSLSVNLGYEPAKPPAQLYHGTAERNLMSIRLQGLKKGKRHHVHLSTDEATARSVGSRHGKPVVLRVRASEMAAAGIEFFLSANGVWLTDSVPAAYLDYPDESDSSIIRFQQT